MLDLCMCAHPHPHDACHVRFTCAHTCAYMHNPPHVHMHVHVHANSNKQVSFNYSTRVTNSEDNLQFYVDDERVWGVSLSTLSAFSLAPSPPRPLRTSSPCALPPSSPLFLPSSPAHCLCAHTPHACSVSPTHPHPYLVATGPPPFYSHLTRRQDTSRDSPRATHPHDPSSKTDKRDLLVSKRDLLTISVLHECIRPPTPGGDATDVCIRVPI